jgi:hypothetical protein
MAFEFLFAPPEVTDWSQLRQGDLLKRNEDLQQALRQAHAYYAEAEDYTHFMVLTQSCDLVRRGKKPKARYISIAAARPLSVLVDRFIEKHKLEGIDLPIPVCSKNREKLVRESLERLLHNTESGYFFLRNGSHPNITKDLCVFLPLSVALRADHYDACLSAKAAQLADVFQARVGWLTGNIYSRVGTPDLDEHEEDAKQYKQDFFDEVLFAHSLWVSSTQLESLKKAITRVQQGKEDAPISRDEARRLALEVPTEQELIAERVVLRLSNERLMEADEARKQQAMNLLKNDKGLAKIIRGLQER